MKRLLAYLFIVLGLGLTFSVSADDYPYGLSENKQYEYTTQFLKDGDYDGAEIAFKKFLETNPNHKLSGDAQYWLAETFRVRQLYTDAASNYLIGYEKYPKSTKGPINLLKLGVSMVQIGEKDMGCKIIVGMSLQYPKASVSVKEKAKYEAQKFKCDKRDTNYLAEIPKLLKEYDLEAKKEPSQTQKVGKKEVRQISLNEVQNLYNQIVSCWSVPLGLPYNADLKVKVKVKLRDDGTIIKTELVNLEKLNAPGNGHLKVLANSILRAIKLCEPLDLPKQSYESWKDMVLNFDAGKMIGGDYSGDLQIAEKESTITPKKKIKVAKVDEPKQEEFKPEKTNQDNIKPIIDIKSEYTFKDAEYKLKGKIKDEGGSEKLYLFSKKGDSKRKLVTTDKKGKFEITGFSLESEEITLIAIDSSNNETEKIVKVIIDIEEETEIAKVYEQLKPIKKGKKDNNRVAIIIGVESYEKSSKALYADNDAKMFKYFATKALGISSANIKLLVDNEAKRLDTIEALKAWLPKKILKDKSELFVFFSGHGYPSNDNNLYLIPQNGDPRFLEESALSKNYIIEQIQKLQPKSVTMFFDACYSGNGKDGEVLVAGLKPIRELEIKEEIPENFYIFSSSDYNQESSTIKEAEHGIFSYYLMKGLQGNADENKDKKITNGELIAYLKDNVSQEAFTQNREQDPMLAGDPDKVLMSYR